MSKHSPMVSVRGLPAHVSYLFALALALAGAGCSGESARGQPEPATPCPNAQSMGVEVLDVDYCLSHEVTARRVADRENTLLLPERVIATGHLPVGWRAHHGLATDSGSIFRANGAEYGWWLIEDKSALFDLRDDREGGGRSCQEFGASIARALAEIKRGMRLESFGHCSWQNTSKISRSPAVGECTWVKEFQPSEGIAGEFTASAARQASIVVASGYLWDHVARYDKGALVACNLVRAANASLIASVAVFEPSAAAANEVAVHGEGCIGWLGGTVSGDELSEERLTQILDGAVASRSKP